MSFNYASTDFGGYLNQSPGNTGAGQPQQWEESSGQGSWEQWGAPAGSAPILPAAPEGPSATWPASSGGRAAAPPPLMDITSKTLGQIMSDVFKSWCGRRMRAPNL